MKRGLLFTVIFAVLSTRCTKMTELATITDMMVKPVIGTELPILSDPIILEVPVTTRLWLLLPDGSWTIVLTVSRR
jgi:hypothetical protein